jgi:hypothetical protein
MKRLFFISLILATVWATYYHYTHNKIEVVTPPAPKVEPVKSVITIIIPNLKIIYLKHGRPIVNARVKEVYPDSMIFVCDRGLVQVLFVDLPPEFHDYYGR